MDRMTSMAVFVTAAEEGSLAAAARRHGLSASMAGKHVAALEAELNVRLMQRSTRCLALTDAGRAYCERCRRILQDFEEAGREASDAQSVVRGILRVAAPLAFGEMRLGAITTAYMEEHPEVVLEVMLSDRYVDLLAERFDVAIRIGRLRDSDLVARTLAPCRMVLCASPEFLDRHGVPESAQDLGDAPRLAFAEAVSRGDWTLVDSDGRSHRIDGPLRMTTNSMRMLLAGALDGLGITYGPSFVFGASIAAGQLVALLPEYRTLDLAIHAVYPNKRHVPMKLRRFVDHLANALGEVASEA